jgi:hypothetical protein
MLESWQQLGETEAKSFPGVRRKGDNKKGKKESWQFFGEFTNIYCA